MLKRTTVAAVLLALGLISSQAHAGGSATVELNGLAVTQTVVALAAGIDTTLLAASPNRRYVALMNIGTNPLTLAFDQAAVAGQGWALDPPVSAGRQGSSQYWEGTGIPNSAIHGISTSGTTVVVLEGR